MLDAAALGRSRVAGALHAAEHAGIGLLPLFAMCDRWDIGGVSTALHPDTGQLTVFVYDGHPGGAGFAERGHAAAIDWLTATRDAIAACECLDGCPSCVQSPKCGNGNNPLHKAAAVRVLDTVLSALAAGPALAIVMGPFIQALLFGVSALNPRTITACAVSLATIAALAGAVPALRASRITPGEALRRR